jgi:hypothetical protein
LSAAGFDPDGMLDDIHGLLWTVRVLSNILRHVAREDIVSDVDIANFEKEKKILQSKLDARTVRPRFGDRDREVVRLRDEEKLTFGQIAKQIRITVAWQRTQNGAQFNADAAKKAYSRHKNRSTDGDK